MKSLTYPIVLWTAFLVAWTSAASITENVTMCSWARLRAGVIRDTLYLDGGELWWQKAFVDGTTSDPTSDGNVEGDMYKLNFSEPFVFGQTNLSGLFTTMQKAGGAANNIAPNYIDGTMFANNDELYLYGGLALDTNATTSQTQDDVLGYEAFQYGPFRQSWSPGFYQGTLPSGVTRYITNGAGVNVPSENLGFYFSGMRAADWGPIDYNTDFAEMPANSLIEIDMSTMRSEKWTNTTLPSNIQPRANAELVWIPVSTQGVLVAIGGVYPPEEIWPYGLNTSQTSQSQSESPTFMTSLPVYDIASQTWYLQNTTGTAPGQLTEFCSVVAAANDSSSFNVYIYGGYDGLNAADEPSDDVWILSIPSFTWIKAYSGSTTHARSGHKCVAPYPDQMFVIGGVHQSQADCVEDIIQVFNLNTLQFQDSYSPTTWSDYQVPSVVTKVIGGGANGGATKTASFSDHNLSDLFQIKYSQTIPKYYPYPVSSNSTNSTDPTASPTAAPAQSGHSGKPWLAPVLGVIFGLIGLTLIIFAILFWRRRRLLSRNSMHGSSSTRNTNRVMRWVNGMPPPDEHKADPSVTSTEADETSQSSPLTGELGGRQRYEMSAAEPTRPPVELATPYNFETHPAYPRSIDYAYGQTPDEPPSSESGSRLGHNNSTSSPSAPSPYIQPFRPEDVGGTTTRGAPSDIMSAPTSSSPASPSDSPVVSPIDSRAQYIRSGRGPPPVPQIPPDIDRRSTHTRNTSSMSSGFNNLPPLDRQVSADEDTRRSIYLASLPNISNQQRGSGGYRGLTAAAGERDSLVSPETPVAGGPAAAPWRDSAGRRRGAKRSQFQEGLSEEED